jgi:hypothetical protein
MALSRDDRTIKLLLLLGMCAATSVMHYADNIVRFVSYPEPPWLDPARVDAFWFFMTPFGLAAYALWRRGWRRSALVASYAYAAMNLLVLGHYLVAPPWRLPALINLFIVLEAGAAILLVAFAVRLQIAGASRGSPR